jgi:hypothetical protein
MRNISKDIESDIPLEDLIYEGINIVGEDRNIFNIYSKGRNIEYIVENDTMNISVFEDGEKVANIKINNWNNKELFYLKSNRFYMTICIKFKGE